MDYEQILHQIHSLIDNKQYENALGIINMILDYEGVDIKELINIKAGILITLNRPDEALELYNHTILYDQIDKQDVLTFSNLQKIYEQLGHVLESKAMGFQARYLSKEEDKDKTSEEALDKKIIELQRKILQKECTPEVYYELAYHHLSKLQVIEGCIYYRKYELERAKEIESLGVTKESKEIEDNKGTEDDEVYNFIKKYRYAVRFYDQLEISEHTYCLLVKEGSSEEKDKFRILAKILEQLGKSVYSIGTFQEKDKVNTKIDLGDRKLEEVLLDLYEAHCKEDSWLVIGDRQQVEGLMAYIPLFKVSQKAYKEGKAENYPTLAAFYMGNYLHTAKYLYGFNVPEMMNREPEVKISIVIPTKSCSYTLRDTLRTCLNQRFQDYEVVVSDNSEEGYMDTYNLVQELNNDKIKYYKVPYSLSLAKSFEYAYLRARGEFIFSIGVDDGLLPYALEYINDALNEHPNENVLLWQRLFYVWPEHSVTGQAGQFTFPIGLKKCKPNTVYVSSQRHMSYVIDLMKERVTGIYGLPMMYINSGMRRRHILEMIKHTGKFLDGTSQDIYTGIATLALYDVVMYIEYPLTIAGMCANSIGVSTVIKRKGVQKYRQFVEEYNKCTFFTDMPGTKSQTKIFPQYDYLLFIYELLKIYDLNVNDKCKEWVEQIDFKVLLAWSIEQFNYSGHICLDFINIARLCAKHLGKEISDWFETFIIPYEQKRKVVQFMTPFAEGMPKNYAKGINGDNLTIDSSELGVKNIYEATEFFVHLLNL